MTTRAERAATRNAVGQGRPTVKENKAIAGELLTRIPQPERPLLNEDALRYWRKVCRILIAREILKPAHLTDLVNYCNSQAYIRQLDARMAEVQESLPGADLKESAVILAELEKLTKLRKMHIDTTLTIGSRFGLDALSEKRFGDKVETAAGKAAAAANPFLKLEL